MKSTIEVLNRLQADGVLGLYAIGGAMAALFYSEPVATFDLDIFVVGPLYDQLRARGYEIDRESVLIEAVPVQFLPAYNALVEEALTAARDVQFDDVPTRVMGVEHLIAIAIQTGRDKDRDRVRHLLRAAGLDRNFLAQICARHTLPLPIVN